MKPFIKTLIVLAVALPSMSFAYDELIEIDSIDQIVSVIQKDEKLNKRVAADKLQIAITSAQQMNRLIREAIYQQGLANDGDISIADTRDVNTYLTTHHANEWAGLRGLANGENSLGYGWVESVVSSTGALGSKAVSVWGDVYNLGFLAYNKDTLADANGNKGRSITSVGWKLQEMMKNEVASGALNNPNIPAVAGTTATALDDMIDIIMHDEGLLRHVSTSNLRLGAAAADAMNHLIVEAIKAEGLANDAVITPADVRTINHYLVEHHAEQWATLHGDDETNEESGFHLVQNNGAYDRMFADSAINTVADGIYHLGFYTNNEDKLKNEDGNDNARFEKVAWWLDTMLKSNMAAGVLDNPKYKEVQGTTNTAFDYIIPYMYNEPGLVRKVSMDDIREAARSANRMNELIVEAIDATNVADDGCYSPEDVQELNRYLSSYYMTEWIELHGNDGTNEESGYHRIQNDGALGNAFGTNVINTLANGIYHLGFATSYDDYLMDEDGKKNVSFKYVAYWLNRVILEDSNGCQSSDSDTGDVPATTRYQPGIDTTWQWQLQGTINDSYDVDVYNIDLFDTPVSKINSLHAQGRKVICYFSAGSYEAWREDAGDFPDEALGSKMDGWDERWIDIRNKTVRSIMAARMDLAKSKGCDGVEPDNVDGYDNGNGFGLTASDQIDYNTFLAQSAHDRNLAVGLKNDVEQVAALEPYFDFAVNEECHTYNECDTLEPFTNNNKPVFNVEYASKYNKSSTFDALCADATERKFQTLYLPLDLDDSFRHSCSE